jgi:hypothetical protein
MLTHYLAAAPVTVHGSGLTVSLCVAFIFGLVTGVFVRGKF